MLRIFALKNCDTCKRVLSELMAANVPHEVIDIRADGLSPGDIAELVSQLGGDALNRRSTTWRQLSEAERDRDPAALIADHPTVMKRPAIENNGTWTVGWNDRIKAPILGKSN